MLACTFASVAADETPAVRHPSYHVPPACAELSPPIPRIMLPCFCIGWYLVSETCCEIHLKNTERSSQSIMSHKSYGWRAVPLAGGGRTGRGPSYCTLSKPDCASPPEIANPSVFPFIIAVTNSYFIAGPIPYVAGIVPFVKTPSDHTRFVDFLRLDGVCGDFKPCSSLLSISTAIHGSGYSGSVPGQPGLA